MTPVRLGAEHSALEETLATLAGVFAAAGYVVVVLQRPLLPGAPRASQRLRHGEGQAQGLDQLLGAGVPAQLEEAVGHRVIFPVR